MRVRALVGALLLVGLFVPFFGCGSATGIDSIAVSPSTVSLAAGATVQLTATGTTSHGNHPSSQSNITNQVTWASSITAVATVSSTGVVTGVGAGTTTITASTNGFGGLITSNVVEVTVTGGGHGGNSTILTGVTVIPGSQSVQSPGVTAQFLAIGTTSAGGTVDVTNQVVWQSSSSQIGTISSTGLATAVSQGTTTITALASNEDGTVVTGTATFTVVGGTPEQITALTMYPGSQSATSQAQTSQFFVLGTDGSTGLQFDVTSQVVWASSNLSVATIGTNGSGTPGLATAVGNGTASITATWTNKDGSKIVSQGTYSVTLGAAQEPLISITVVPNGITVSNRGMTGQFLAFGTYSTTPTVRDLTNQVTWVTTLPDVASINSAGVSGEPAGLATAQGYTGFTDIFAEATNPDGTVVVSSPQLFTCKDPITQVCDQEIAHPQFATITVFNAGENNTTWLITAPSDTGTPNLIHCGPGSTSGGSVCTGTYETGSTIVITASPLGAGFGGWSSGDGVGGGVGCVPAPGYTLLNSPTCTVTLAGDTSIGAIFY
ncbi:Ig domain-containing protein [Acidicapsa dinghuensis]|uniref:Ig domain-containing protein n=1 Tax=Acidicapsa dinghuensis TaxID=2218256 RepID=A0ABW1EEZ4_9BACT|nr:Ig-like domain-containing protein [Acidicapsa dinghuensis]